MTKGLNILLKFIDKNNSFPARITREFLSCEFSKKNYREAWNDLVAYCFIDL